MLWHTSSGGAAGLGGEASDGGQQRVRIVVDIAEHRFQVDRCAAVAGGGQRRLHVEPDGVSAGIAVHQQHRRRVAAGQGVGRRGKGRVRAERLQPVEHAQHGHTFGQVAAQRVRQAQGPPGGGQLGGRAGG
ncbi:hypothetical protein [Cupriavidus necator]|uniref:hypothetical protein n=1 Tax=Cupriavidus necator TaxID=106590 RepID=UPI001E563C5B|nr:hypothetical protein [Cupriavidus necator]